MKGFVLAGTKSGIGKTTVSMALMSVFEDVSPFKVGPDYIDPSFHKFITNNSSYNLDLFLMGEDGVKYSFNKHKKKFSIVEGVMGLYDGLQNSLDNYSTAHLSRVLNLPVILVVDAAGKSTSVAAEVLGYQLLDPRVKIAGVIINKVTSEKLYYMLKDAIETYTSIPCLGYLKKDENLAISSRHLGLLRADEVQDLKEKKLVLKKEIEKTVDLKKLEEIAEMNETSEFLDIFKSFENQYSGMKIGVAKDSAFSFYYEDNLELLKRMGIEIVEFSPLQDKKIPAVDLLYFGGGYPENYCKELSENTSFKESLFQYHKDGGYIYAECGGFMYLTKGIKTLAGDFYPMANLVDATIKMTERLFISRFGYIDLEYGDLSGRAHEFHYSTIDSIGSDKRVFKLKKADGREWLCGYKNKNLIAGYPHLHFFKNHDILISILEGAKK
ncbi:MAG: cobyrinate a,c-diamide synthase [Cetobacterium sp.]